MHKVMWVRGVSFLLASLLLMTMFLFQGCATEILNTKIDNAEKNLSHGKESEENLKDLAPVFPPSLVARHKIASIVDSIIKGEYAFGTMKAELAEIQGATFTPNYLKVEAGYLLTLLERMETLQKSAAKAKEYAKEIEEQKHNLEVARKEIETLKKENEDIKKENEDIKKEIELLSYKLKKLEEIHIESVKRRGKQ